GVARVDRDLLERALERRAVVALESCRDAGCVLAQRGDHATMKRRDFGEWRARVPLERGERRREPREGGGGVVEVRAGGGDGRIGGVQIRWLPAPQLCEFGLKQRERVRETGRAWPRPRAAQDRLLEHGDCACVHTRGGTKPQERVLEEREERNRRNSAKRGFRRQACEQPRGRLGERIAAGRV